MSRGSFISGLAKKPALAGLASVIIGLLLATGLTPGIALAETGSPVPEVPSSDVSGVAQRKAKTSGKRIELVDLRTETTTVFVNPDGTKTVEYSGSPIRIPSDTIDGWTNVDLDLEKVAADKIAPKASPIDLTIGTAGSLEAARLTYDDGSYLAVTWKTPLPEPEIEDGKAIFAVADEVDLVVTATASGFAAHIVLNEQPDEDIDSFVLGIRTSEIELSESRGQLVARDADGSVVARTQTMTAWDSSRDAGEDPTEIVALDAQLEPVYSTPTAARQELTLSAPAGFLDDPNTVYPVTLDPDIDALVQHRDTYAVDGSSTTYSSAQILRVGSNDDVHASQSYLKFSTNGIEGANQTVTSASLKLYQYYAPSCVARQMRVSPLTEAFSSTTTWNTRPAATSTNSTTSNFNRGNGSSCAAGVEPLDVTAMVKRWASGALANNGMRLSVDLANSENSNFDKRFCSMDFSSAHATCNSAVRQPKLSVTYNTTPATPATITVSPFEHRGSYDTATSPSPVFTTVASDPDADAVRVTYEVHDSNVPDADSKKTQCTTDYFASGAQAACASPIQLPDGAYWVRASVSDGITVSDWSSPLKIQVVADDVSPPAQTVWPTVSVALAPTYQDVDGMHVQSETPRISFTATDEVLPATGYQNYQFHFVVRNESSGFVWPETYVHSTRNGTVSSGSIPIVRGILSDGGHYSLRYHLAAASSQGNSATAEGPWSDWTEFAVTTPQAKPTLLSPKDGTLTTSTPELKAQIQDFKPGRGQTVNFRVESGWQGGAPVVIETGTAVPDLEGIATFSPQPLPAQGSYRWQASVSGNGPSEWTSFAEFQASGVPSAVQNITVTNFRRDVHVTWAAPADTLALSPVETYVVTLNPGNFEIETDGQSLAADFAGVTNGDHTVVVRATNQFGDGPQSSSQFTLNPMVPDTVQNLDVAVSGTEAVATWGPPLDDGGSPVIRYGVKVTSHCDWSVISDVQTTSTTATFADLEEGCTYDAKVTPVSIIGDGWSVAKDFTAYGLPGAPTDLEVRPGDESLEIYWTAPEDDNGSAVSGYEVVLNPGHVVKSVALTTGVRQGIRVDGLQNGTNYSISVTAQNAAGLGFALESANVASSFTTPDSDANDTDQDGLPDIFERRVGSDPLLADSDSDGLTDKQEAISLGGLVSPSSADTDDDGVLDSLEDSDEDGMSNSVEVLSGTKPGAPDSDNDGLDDGAEDEEGSDPLSTDTDGDGVDDGDEVRFGLDPTDADSDGDGVDDGVAQVATTLRSKGLDHGSSDNAIAPATARIQGSPNSLSTYSISETEATDVSGAITSIAVVDTTETPGASRRGPSSSVTSLKLGYSAAVAAERLNSLAPVIWNDTTGTWEFVDNDVSVSTASRTISVMSPTTGLQYAVVDMSAWRANANQCGGAAPIDLEVVFDNTWSVPANDVSGERFEAVRAVLSSLKVGDRVSMSAIRVTGVIGRGGTSASFYIYNRVDDAPEALKPEFLRGTTSVEEALANLDAFKAEFSSPELASDEQDSTRRAEGLLASSNGSSIFDFDEVNPFEPGFQPQKCRQTAMLYVTDGGLLPYANQEAYDNADQQTHLELGYNYVPLSEREVPIHVLDVGRGSPYGAQEMIDLAEKTGGTYSYVPTATDLGDWIADVTPPPLDEESDDPNDSDGDGIPNWVEKHGVTSTMTNPSNHSRFFSDPHNPDSDGDGLRDGEEYGRPATRAQLGATYNASRPITAYAVVSNPAERDSDFDEVGDPEEIETGSNALNRDVDHDTIDDGKELENGTLSYMPDSDMDGYSDNFELAGFADGFDPIVWQEPIDPNEWLVDAWIGFSCGEMEFCSKSTIPWLVGNVASGLLVFGDIRDAVATAARGDFLTAGFCLAGIVPGVGDVAGTSLKFVRFFRKLVSGVARSVPSLGSPFASHRKAAVKFLSDVFKENDDAFFAALKLGDPDAVGMIDKLRSGTSDLLARKMLVGNGMDRLKPIFDYENLITVNYAGKFPTIMNGGNAGERFVEELNGIFTIPPKERFLTGFGTYRYPDVFTVRQALVDGDLKNFYKINESKVGHARGAKIEEQARRDVALAQGLGNKNVEQVTWHFFVSGSNYNFGASKEVLDILKQANILVVMHLVP